MNGKANPTLNAIEVVPNTFGLTVFELVEKVKERMPRTPTKADTGLVSLYRAPSHKTDSGKKSYLEGRVNAWLLVDKRGPKDCQPLCPITAQ